MRKKMTMTQKILRGLDKGQAPADIAKRLGCSVQNVYNARYRYRRDATPSVTQPTVTSSPIKRPRGRPRKNIDTSDGGKVVVATPVVSVPPSLWQRIKATVVGVWR